MNFFNNANKNKLNCGNIYFRNNINISMSNSIFNNNLCKSNGGVLYVFILDK